MYNETLVDRVENVNMSYAVDKRYWREDGRNRGIRYVSGR